MLDDFQHKIESLQAFDFGREMETIVENHKDKISEYVKDQLASGRDGNGEPVKLFDHTEYAPLTIELKRKNGQGLGAVTDRVTNYMTGKFYQSLKPEIQNGAFELDSDVSYFGDIRLRSNDSGALLEVSEENRREFAETITLPEITESFKAKTGFTITHE